MMVFIFEFGEGEERAAIKADNIPLAKARLSVLLTPTLGDEADKTAREAKVLWSSVMGDQLL